MQILIKLLVFVLFLVVSLAVLHKADASSLQDAAQKYCDSYSTDCSQAMLHKVLNVVATTGTCVAVTQRFSVIGSDKNDQNNWFLVTEIGSSKDILKSTLKHIKQFTTGKIVWAEPVPELRLAGTHFCHHIIKHPQSDTSQVLGLLVYKEHK